MGNIYYFYINPKTKETKNCTNDSITINIIAIDFADLILINIYL